MQRVTKSNIIKRHFQNDIRYNIMFSYRRKQGKQLSLKSYRIQALNLNCTPPRVGNFFRANDSDDIML